MLADRNLIPSGRRSTDKPVARAAETRRAPGRMQARNSTYVPRETPTSANIVLDQAHMSQLLDATAALIQAVTPTMPIPPVAARPISTVQVQAPTEPVAQPKVVEPTKTPAPKSARKTAAQRRATDKPAPASVVDVPAPATATKKYDGPMLALRQRSKAGLYAKAANGQPSCGDEIAQMLGALRPEFVIKACLLAMALDFNPYAHLNIGQQSMNLRNKLRGCIKAGEFGMGVISEAVEEALAMQDQANH